MGVVALSAAGGAWITWNTGKSMPTRMDALLEHANQQLQVALGHEGEARIELLSSTFHTFSADARYRVTYESLGQAPVQLAFVDRIEYGPLPWSRVKRMELMPVMATSNFSLVKTEGSTTWFSASKGEIPLRGAIKVNYDETINTHLQFAPFEITEQNCSLSSSGGSLFLTSAQDDTTVTISGEMERLNIHLKYENIRDPQGVLRESDDRVEAAMLRLLTNRPRFVLEELSFDVDLNGKKMTREEFLRTIWITMAKRSLPSLFWNPQH